METLVCVSRRGRALRPQPQPHDSQFFHIAHTLWQATAFRELEPQCRRIALDGRLLLSLPKAPTCVGSWRRCLDWVSIRQRANSPSFSTIRMTQAPEAQGEALWPWKGLLDGDARVCRLRDFLCVLRLPSTSEETEAVLRWAEGTRLPAVQRLLSLCGPGELETSGQLRLLLAGLLAVEQLHGRLGLEALGRVDAVCGNFWAGAVFAGAVALEDAVGATHASGDCCAARGRWKAARIPLLLGMPARAVRSAALLGACARHAACEELSALALEGPAANVLAWEPCIDLGAQV